MIFTNKKKGPSSAKSESAKEYFTQQLVENNYRNRFWITLITMITFLVLIVGIGLAMISDATVGSDWKEILLLLIGAFIGSYSDIIRFWFKNEELQQKMIEMAEEEDDLESETKQDSEKLLKG